VNSSGTFATFTAIRRASSFVSDRSRLLLCLEFSPSYLSKRFPENAVTELRDKKYEHSSVGIDSA
jgi:hypothetical protein